MIVCSTENIKKAYGDRLLFENGSFGLEDTDRLGVIGVNGAGKSTLLKILGGLVTPDEGQVVYKRDAKIQYLPQEPSFGKGKTVLEAIFEGGMPELRLIERYEALMEVLKERTSDDLIKELGVLQGELEAKEVWALERKAKMILTRLGVDYFQQEVQTLSGGQIKRIALARALIHPADLLILDEPTNHLDDETIEWLEDYLKERKGALAMITHDRYFLDRVTNRLLEVDDGALYTYQGNYEAYLAAKEERLRRQEVQAEKASRLYAQELKWIRAGVQGRGTKQKARKQRFEDLDKGIAPSKEDLVLETPYRRLGKTIIDLKQVGKAYDDKVLIKDFSLVIKKGDRIGIAGENGAGKTTLLNMIAHKISPDQGELQWGKTVVMGYYSQHHDELPEELRLIDYLEETSAHVMTASGAMITAGQLLERFLFPSDKHYQYIKTLSGGEKRRLYLAKVLMGAPNVLLLDEPTNDLDLQTLGVLEEYLDYFPGVVIAVSHDRYFMDKAMDQIIGFHEGGHLALYTSLDKYKMEKRRRKQTPEKQDKPKEEKRPKKTVFSYKEKRAYETIDEDIANLEGQLEKIEEDMMKAGADYDRLRALDQEKDDLTKALEDKLELWAYLMEKAEQIEKEKER